MFDQILRQEGGTDKVEKREAGRYVKALEALHKAADSQVAEVVDDLVNLSLAKGTQSGHEIATQS